MCKIGFRLRNIFLHRRDTGLSWQSSQSSSHCSWSYRYLSSNVCKQPIRILYGSQGGTAQVFGMQLLEELERQQEYRQDDNLKIMTLNDAVGVDWATNASTINVIIVSVAGVGEPPDNARLFYDNLTNMQNPSTISVDDRKPLSGVQYTVFGLGNSIAHPNHFNIIGKNVDFKLEELGASRIYPMGLGDDGDCIEDDFDTWMNGLLNYLRNGTNHEQLTSAEETPCAISKTLSLESNDQRTDSSSKNPPLKLESPASFQLKHKNLLHCSFYQSRVAEMEVLDHRTLTLDGGEQGMRELSLRLPPNMSYEVGDHVIIYPRNARCMVEAVLQLYRSINPHSLIRDGGFGFPHPVGISIDETLLQCIDLGAVPTPSLARYLLQGQEMDYKRDIASPRKTVLNLIHETGRIPPLQDLLRMLPKMQPRYYSISTSPRVNPDLIGVTYRPVKYLSSSGNLREGVCTSYMSSLTNGSLVVGGVRSNPSFRLPKDPRVPIILIAGGCGVAPIRAFLEDRLASDLNALGDSMLFLGFRSSSDEVYHDLINKALSHRALSTAHISYSEECSSSNQMCRTVSKNVGEHADTVIDWIENRAARVFLCGGARSFGAAMEAEFLEMLKTHKGLDPEAAAKYLRKLISEGQLCEDLAD